MSALYFSYNILIILISACGLMANMQEGNSIIAAASPYRYILYSAILIVLVYLIVMSQTRSLVKTRRKLKEKEHVLEEVERQKSELEIRERNITDSLNYAQRIQEALLPSEDYFRSFFRESFIFFKPKDIVSGDFYWIGEKGGRIFIVAADCTGHGVPGALMSMIGIEIIEKTINEDNIDIPAAILAILNKGLEKTFSREKNIGTIIRDGMDIGLCVIDHKRKKIEYAGAFFPLYLVRNNSLIEIKGDKLIIGMNPEGKAYENHEIDLMEDDILYLFSDGYVDQFGGSENKKFMYRRFRYLLTTIHRFPVNDQKSVLEESIRTWMGSAPQLDDMMVIGFKPFSGKN
ncbi:MAG: SpoIIE family protein phosphatase [Bacteroidales bacterium]